MSNFNIKVVELANYVAPNHIENHKKGWVSYGDGNDFPQYIIDLYNNSPTNNACIRGTSNMIYGQGVEAVASDRRLSGYLQLKKIFSKTDVRNVCNDFKAFGMAAFEVIMAKDGTVAKAVHCPMNYLRSGICDDEGNVNEWHYASDWSDSDSNKFETTVIKAFGRHGNDPRAIAVIKPYTFGSYYYATPDYIGGLAWADVETELSNYHLSNLRNGMWPGMLINFNNGLPTEDEQTLIERDIQRKWGKSSNTGRFVLAFNRDKESAATIEPIQLSDAAEQFQAVSAEALEKIMLSHRITSPMLLGIKNNTGLGNNAEELKSAHALFVNTVVKPMQDAILETMDAILMHNDVTLDIYFKPLTPLEFANYDLKADAETVEKNTGVSMAAERPTLQDDVAEDWLSYLNGKGETIDAEEWELESEEDVTDPENEEARTKLFNRFADPEQKSKEGDAGLYKVRYRYSQLSNPRSRLFCRNMVEASKAGVVYRLEDIREMTEAKLNIDLSPADCKRCGYDIWLYKGGARCKHHWVRQVYFRKRDNGKFLPKSETESLENDARVSVASAERAGVPTDKLKPKGYDEAATPEYLKPNKGFKK